MKTSISCKKRGDTPISVTSYSWLTLHPPDSTSPSGSAWLPSFAGYSKQAVLFSVLLWVRQGRLQQRLLFLLRSTETQISWEKKCGVCKQKVIGQEVFIIFSETATSNSRRSQTQTLWKCDSSFTLTGDWLSYSPYRTTVESNINTMRIRNMITH